MDNKIMIISNGNKIEKLCLMTLIINNKIKKQDTVVNSGEEILKYYNLNFCKYCMLIVNNKHACITKKNQFQLKIENILIAKLIVRTLFAEISLVNNEIREITSFFDRTLHKFGAGNCFICKIWKLPNIFEKCTRCDQVFCVSCCQDYLNATRWHCKSCGKENKYKSIPKLWK